MTNLEDVPVHPDYHWDDAPPAELVQAFVGLLEMDASPMRRMAARVQARTAVTTLMRRYRIQGVPPARCLAFVRSAFRHALATAVAAGQAVAADHIPPTVRTLREEVVRWAMRAGSPDYSAPHAATPIPVAVRAQTVEASASL